MSAEFYVVFDDPAWYQKNRSTVRSFIQSLATFSKRVNDQEYWLKGGEVKADWAFSVRIFLRNRDIVLEISSHPPPIVNDIRTLNEFIAENANAKVVDDDGEIIDGYRQPPPGPSST